MEKANKKAIVVGAGLSGAVIARELAEQGYDVQVFERRDHIGGNMFDYVDEHGILVHKYGPHTFHTTKKELFDYICKYGEWDEYHLTCGAVINGKCTPTPFNFQTIDDFFAPNEAKAIKEVLLHEFPSRETVTVVEALNCPNPLVRKYAEFLFENDYRPYSAKQWGLDPSQIDPSILKRVPLRLSYKIGYFDDPYQAMPRISYVEFFENLLDHPNISVELNHDALKDLSIEDGQILYLGQKVDYPIVYTGPIDELFNHAYGPLPYRSLRFEFNHEPIDSKQDMPVVAYPQEPGFVRIIEFKKLPVQNVPGTTYEKEYSLPTSSGGNDEPYYPLLTEKSQENYAKYKEMAEKVPYLYVCGRLGDFKYYNMDQALEAALAIANKILR
ncbi:MAG: UDP-galactopyranose mutase [Bacilli bacterium]|nr:UDP-galactopyranose mutase [Bacilli bacterium]